MAFLEGMRELVIVLLRLARQPTVLAQTGTSAHGPLFGADSPAGDSSGHVASMARGRDDDLGIDQGIGASPLLPHVGGEYSDLNASLSLARRIEGSACGGSARRSVTTRLEGRHLEYLGSGKLTAAPRPQDHAADELLRERCVGCVLRYLHAAHAARTGRGRTRHVGGTRARQQFARLDENGVWRRPPRCGKHASLTFVVCAWP